MEFQFNNCLSLTTYYNNSLLFEKCYDLKCNFIVPSTLCPPSLTEVQLATC